MYNILRMSQYWSIFSCSPHILLYSIRTRILLIHSPYTNCKTHGNNFSLGVWWMDMQNCRRCLSSSPSQHCWEMIFNKIVVKPHGFLVHADTIICCIKHHTHVVHKYSRGFVYLDPNLYKVVPDHNILLDIILQWFKLGSKCWGLHHSLDFW